MPRAGAARRGRGARCALQPFYDFLGVEPNPIPVKALLQRLGIGAGLRLPLLPLSGTHADADAERLPPTSPPAIEQSMPRLDRGLTQETPA